MIGRLDVDPYEDTQPSSPIPTAPADDPVELAIARTVTPQIAPETMAELVFGAPAGAAPANDELSDGVPVAIGGPRDG